jgi:hypothetical protein
MSLIFALEYIKGKAHKHQKNRRWDWMRHLNVTGWKHKYCKQKDRRFNRS